MIFKEIDNMGDVEVICHYFEYSGYCYTQCYYINFIHMTKDTAGFLSSKQRISPPEATKLVNKSMACAESSFRPG
jgi:hypothetical protein